MNYKATPFVVISLITVGCYHENIKPKSETSIDYLIFGHTASFCMNCDAVYKIADEKLFGANHQMILDPQSVQLNPLPRHSYELVSSLEAKVPSQLLDGPTTGVQTIGSYFPDVGHYYIEVSQNHKIHRWYIEASNAPEYMKDFLKDVSDAINELR